MFPTENYTWYYFGCLRTTGHHLVDRFGKSSYRRDLVSFDGQLCPLDTTLYRGLVTRIPHLKYTALAWWDQTVDTRPGSNSIIFAPSLECSIASMESGLDKWFGWARKRLPQPLVISEDIRTWIKH